MLAEEWENTLYVPPYTRRIACYTCWRNFTCFLSFEWCFWCILEHALWEVVNTVLLCRYHMFSMSNFCITECVTDLLTSFCHSGCLLAQLYWAFFYICVRLWTMGARFSAPAQTVPGAHPASCTMGTGRFPGVKAAEAWCWPPTPI